MKKTMQKKLIVLLLVLAILTSLVLCGCGDKKVSKRVTIYLVDADRSAVECTAVTTGDNFADLLVEKQNELGIKYEDSAYGMYITSIRGWEMPANSFVSVLASFRTVEGSDAIYTDPSSQYNLHYVCMNGAECDSTLVGASSLPLVDGATYVLIIVRY